MKQQGVYDLQQIVRLLQEARAGDAEAACLRLLSSRPDDPDLLHLAGLAKRAQGRLAEARDSLLSAIRVRPDDVHQHANLGVVLSEMGDYEGAVASLGHAILLQPDHAEAYYNLGNACAAQGQLVAAAAAYRVAIKYQPVHVQAVLNLATALEALGQPDASMEVLQDAISRLPGNPALLNNLGNLLGSHGRPDEAVEILKRASRCAPDSTVILSNLLYRALFSPSCPQADIEIWLSRWEGLLGPAALLPAAAHDLDPERPLRVGYVSPHWREHVLGRNLLPFCTERSPDHVVVVYSDVAKPDRLTEIFRSWADEWKDCSVDDDDCLAKRIRADRIDVLIDLSLHMPGNRLGVFAQRAAPVQLTFGGYPGMTGLTNMDGRLTDHYLEPYPEGATREKPYYMGPSFWCYAPESSEPPVSDSPDRPITFGCLHSFAKQNERVWALWAQVLQAVPDSRLHLLVSSEYGRGLVVEAMRRHGVRSDRLQFVEPMPHSRYLQEYASIDVLLDTFPYQGHTSLMDALWMGVPVVSLVGSAPVSRASLSILSNLGLPQFAVTHERDFVSKARELATDHKSRKELRRTLRGRLQASPLMDAARFSADFRRACRHFWRSFCIARSVASRPRS
jgi:predicted O-linked N-acetylglucosamine transferase (SPINDLY family)